MHKPLIAGNWKMHGTIKSAKALVEGIKEGASALDAIDILVCPALIHIDQVTNLLGGSNILCGAQNLYIGTQGAYTGEVSAFMLADLGCQFVLVGHSERRALFHENLELVGEKFKAAVAAGITPILCVGETRSEREQGLTEHIVKTQLESVIKIAGIDAFATAVIAYEPVWAIGTGLTATPDEAQAVHAYIRHFIKQNSVDIGTTIRILYGGSMKADNAASLLAMPDINGGLIGGASLEATSFLAICTVANTMQTRANGHIPKTA